MHPGSERGTVCGSSGFMVEIEKLLVTIDYADLEHSPLIYDITYLRFLSGDKSSMVLVFISHRFSCSGGKKALNARAKILLTHGRESKLPLKVFREKSPSKLGN